MICVPPSAGATRPGEVRARASHQVFEAFLRRRPWPAPGLHATGKLYSSRAGRGRWLRIERAGPGGRRGRRPSPGGAGGAEQLQPGPTPHRGRAARTSLAWVNKLPCALTVTAAGSASRPRSDGRARACFRCGRRIAGDRPCALRNAAACAPNHRFAL